MSEILNVSSPTSMEASVSSASAFERHHIKAGNEVMKTSIVFSSYSNNSFTATFHPVSPNVIIDKRVLLKAVVNITNVDGVADRSLRAFPLSSVIANITVTVNGASSTSQPSHVIHAMTRYNNTVEYRSKNWCMTPSQLDKFSEYSQMPEFDPTAIQAKSLASGGADVAGTFTHLRVPCSPFSDDVYNSSVEPSRISFPHTGDNFTLVEPLFHPLFCDSTECEEGITNVNDISITIQFNNTLTNMVSSVTAGTAPVVNLIQSPPSLLITYVQPTNPPPLQVYVPFQDHFIREMNLGAINTTAGATSHKFNNIIMARVPSKIYLFAMVSKGTKTYTDADGFLNISRVNLTVGLKSGVLAASTEEQLYQMSVQNGLNMTWNQWHQKLGSVLCIDVAKDIGGFTPGSQENFSIAVDCTMRSNNYTTFKTMTGDTNRTYDFYFVAELDGVYKITSESSEQIMGNTSQTLVEAEENETDPNKGTQHQGFTGGKFSFRKLFKGMRDGFRVVAPVLEQIAPNPKVKQGLELLQNLNGKGLLRG